MTRLEANLEILFKLRQFFVSNPDMRFMQSLQALKLQKIFIDTDIYGNIEKQYIEDNFLEESIKTLEKLK